MSFRTLLINMNNLIVECSRDVFSKQVTIISSSMFPALRKRAPMDAILMAR